MEEFIGKFVAEDKIKTVKVSERTTYERNQVVDLVFEDKSTRSLPLEVLRVVATKEVSDSTTLRNTRAFILRKRIVEVLLESEMPVEQIEYVLSSTADSITMNLEKANAKLWGMELHKRTLRDVDVILKSEKSKKGN